MGKDERLAARDPQKGREDQGGKSGGGTYGWRTDAEGLPGQGEKPERTMLGSFARKLEC